MSRGKLYVVGIGPGARELRTIKAQEVLERSEIIVGYDTYLRLIRDVLDGKNVVGSGMREEVLRASLAIDLAMSGKTVSLISGGDPQVYGMAGLVFEIMARRDIDLDVEVVPGVTAALAAAARLGSPLSSDFAVISLSDLLVPREEILMRVQKAAEADFVIALYNPVKKDLLMEAMSLISRYRDRDTPVGIARAVFRDGEKIVVTDLGSWDMYINEIDMITTIIVGNSRSYRYRNYIITPRGYRLL